ncbi:MAG: uroporphyrinogen decarboxylase, partial [Sciscionella sp.]|nr:uroporphyrinogen decarboxylase [Sciscionella sp.]
MHWATRVSTHSSTNPATAPAASRRHLSAAPLLVVARGGKPTHTPVWFMRQAGRSLPEYRAARGDVPMLLACMTPELACEITVQPVRRHGVDAAILFSDIVVPLHAAGVDVDIVAGTGPVVAHPVRTVADVAALPRLDADRVRPVADTVGLLLGELGQTPLIGFAGAPFTLASYLVEGGPSRTYQRTKALMHGDPTTWHALAGALAELTLTFLRV